MFDIMLFKIEIEGNADLIKSVIEFAEQEKKRQMDAGRKGLDILFQEQTLDFGMNYERVEI